MRVIITNSARKFIGEAAHCLSLAKELSRRGHEPLLVVRRGFELERRAAAAGLPVLSLRFPGGFSLSGDISDVREFAAVANQFKPDVIHCHRGKDHWSATAAAKLIRRRIPVVRTRHVVVPVRDHFFNRWLFGAATARIICVSRKAEQTFPSKWGKVRAKIEVIHSAVDQECFRPDARDDRWRAEAGIMTGDRLIGLIARFQNIKGQHIFLEAAAVVAQRFPNTRFLLAGAGSSHKYEQARTLAAQLGIADRVLLRGWLENINCVIASLDVGVIASLGSEGSSRIAMEYMASGVPVVATAVGGIPDIIQNDKTGLLVQPGNASELADAICRVLATPDLAADLRDAALQRVRHYHTFDRWIADTTSVYQRAIDRARSPEPHA